MSKDMERHRLEPFTRYAKVVGGSQETTKRFQKRRNRRETEKKGAHKRKRVFGKGKRGKRPGKHTRKKLNWRDLWGGKQNKKTKKKKKKNQKGWGGPQKGPRTNQLSSRKNAETTATL